jgi:hypothetical protein
MRRRHGSVEQLRSGAWRARTRVDGKLVTVATVGSEKEADDALALFAEGRLEHAPVAGRTLASWGVEFLDARETGGEHRSVGRDRHVWKRVSTSKLADMPLPEITVRDIREWVATQAKTVSSKTKKRPSPQTIKNALNLLRVCLEGACQSGLIERNPARDVRAPKMARTDDAWTWLRLDELAKLLDKLSDDDRAPGDAHRHRPLQLGTYADQARQGADDLPIQRSRGGPQAAAVTLWSLRKGLSEPRRGSAHAQPTAEAI